MRIHLLHGADLSPATPALMREMVERQGGSISFLRVPERLVAGLPTMSSFPVAMWYRLFLPELLPSVDTALYLDCDTIAVGALEPLTQLDLSEHYLGAVTNVFQDDGSDRRPERLGLAGPHVYFNSGVLLMNLALMRRDDCTAALRDYAVQHPDLVWPDQDALNVVLGARRLPLHPRWNCMNSVLSFPWSAEVFGPVAAAEARQHPAIRHFEGPSINKPWHLLCSHDMRDLYREHRRQTPWPRYRPEGTTPRNLLRRLGADVRRAVALRINRR